MTSRVPGPTIMGSEASRVPTLIKSDVPVFDDRTQRGNTYTHPDTGKVHDGVPGAHTTFPSCAGSPVPPVLWKNPQATTGTGVRLTRDGVP